MVDPVSTKREVLSTISRLFDPLGLVGPIVVRAKLIMQEAWISNLGWDEPLTEGLRRAWDAYVGDLRGVGEIRVPRRIVRGSNAMRLNLHAFCDASLKAYGACIYLQVIDRNNTSSSLLICSKSRVAPIKSKTITLPRLELCGAIVLVRLVQNVKRALKIAFDEVHAWSDSTLVLAWIAGDPSRQKTFISNRVAEIQSVLPSMHWHHVDGIENPADLISRGTSLENLKQSKIWWEGPHWLSRLERFEQYGLQPSLTEEDERECGFSEVLTDLRAGKQVRTSSSLLALKPFIDKEGILRVGGRIQNSNLTFENKHPIILPSNSRFTQLLFEREHIRLLHIGPQALLCSIREKYWPLRGKNIARGVTHRCVTCFRNKPKMLSQIMGQLPADRVTPNRPFFVTGVDFAGPIVTLLNRGRGRKTGKSYISLFVCFTTKAVHLETVSDLSSASFIAALRRFAGRRGYPQPPHMGGLWEAGVKSCKFHLKRVVGESLLTFEELSTVLIQIEACLNSRPICHLPSTSADLQPLTPGHFLIGGSLTALPDIDMTELPINRLDRWQIVHKITQDFWKRWSQEYLTSLQGRVKWNREQINLNIDDVVLIQDINAPPLRWKLGRVNELHKGRDDKVRIVTLQTANGTYKRAINKLCKLPIAEMKSNLRS
ncbi:PREDICTED: uncharacterized protein LOC105556617 [Vollenhovia emeryi]|uniref:uncharacterized protein LOC105556617 n=1 Tax=Vollenhovia emeryi TaxID=411798 RepID=UPI0005F52B7A|nr:PREDICTED: uncharacterized protein LOC105556617 [Vollenhovia emeryi]